MGFGSCERASVFVYRSVDVARNDRIVDIYSKTLRSLLPLVSLCETDQTLHAQNPAKTVLVLLTY